MCHQCIYNNTMLLAAIIRGGTEPYIWRSATGEVEQTVDVGPLRAGLINVIEALGPPVKKAEAEAAREAAQPRIQAAFAGMTAAQIGDLGRLVTDCRVALTAVSQLGIMELQRRREDGDTTASDELESSVKTGDDPIIAIIMEQQRAPSGAEPNYTH